ncbi:MAG: hypothetical protein DHS20C17_21490 [Cyclobacteriaceae bacterium]|nr:MAG: hypothetical protein DHS20C17_21490 [Cyclobacteriaceae bacterium]
MFEDYYKLLGIDYNADRKTIQKAFHNLAKLYHPDKNPDSAEAAEKFKQLSEAYITLSDPQKKSKYDLKLRYGDYALFVAKAQKRRYTARKAAHRTSPFYYRKKVAFTRQARILGSISIAAIILTVAFTTVFFTRYNAQFDFQKGLANYHNKRYSSAYFNLKESISPLNPYLAAAHLLMAEICFHQQKDLSLSRNHIIKGYQANPSDSINARLLYLEGKLDYQQGDNIAAYQKFKEATDHLPNFDSATYRMGELDLFVFARFDQALIHFQTLVKHNPENHQAVLASAYCHQKLGQHQMAISQIDQFMSMQESVGMAYYIKAISAQALQMKNISCQNFLEANNLGVPAALDSLNSYCGMSITR